MNTIKRQTIINEITNKVINLSNEEFESLNYNGLDNVTITLNDNDTQSIEMNNLMLFINSNFNKIATSLYHSSKLDLFVEIVHC